MKETGNPTIDALFEEGPNLREESQQAILEMGSDAVPQLVEIVSDRELWDDEAPGEGWAPIWAVRLLGEIGDERAVEPLLEAYHDAQPDFIVHEDLRDALAALGESVVQPGLEMLQKSDDEWFIEDLADLFARLDVHDDKVFAVLLRHIKKNPARAAENLKRYGDRRAADALAAVIDSYDVGRQENPLTRQDVLESADAIEALGCELTPPQETKVALLRNRPKSGREKLREILARGRSGEDVTIGEDTYVKEERKNRGRNEPCWCGSGAKYKHCHWNEDHQ